MYEVGILCLFSVTYEQQMLSCRAGTLCSQTPHRDNWSFESLMLSSPLSSTAARTMPVMSTAPRRRLRCNNQYKSSDGEPTLGRRQHHLHEIPRLRLECHHL